MSSLYPSQLAGDIMEIIPCSKGKWIRSTKSSTLTNYCLGQCKSGHCTPVPFAQGLLLPASKRPFHYAYFSTFIVLFGLSRRMTPLLKLL